MGAPRRARGAPASDARDCGETDTTTTAPGSVSFALSSLTLWACGGGKHAASGAARAAVG